MSNELTDTQKSNKLRCSLSTRASHIIKNRHFDEYQEVYWNLLREHGLKPTNNSNHMLSLTEENRKLKEKISVMIARGAEVIEFEEDR